MRLHRRQVGATSIAPIRFGGDGGAALAPAVVIG